MQFNPGDGSGIVDDIDFLLNTSVTDYPLAQKTRNANRHYDETVALILQSDGRWQWDDSNNTNLPIATTTLVSNQQDYQIAGGTFLDITRVEVLDQNGNYYLLTPIDQHEVTDQSLSEFLKTPGRPLYYDKLGDSVFLYPKPASGSVTLAAGLKVYYQRNASYFATTDTTKSPGFAAPFHRLISLGAAIDYCLANTILLKSEFLTPLYQKMQQDCMAFYSSRSKDESVRMKVRKESYGADFSNINYNNSDKVAFY